MKKQAKVESRNITIVCAQYLKVKDKRSCLAGVLSDSEKQREMVKRISQLNKVIHQQKANCFLDVTM